MQNFINFQKKELDSKSNSNPIIINNKIFNFKNKLLEILQIELKNFKIYSLDFLKNIIMRGLRIYQKKNSIGWQRNIREKKIDINLLAIYKILGINNQDFFSSSPDKQIEIIKSHIYHDDLINLERTFNYLIAGKLQNFIIKCRIENAQHKCIWTKIEGEMLTNGNNQQIIQGRIIDITKIQQINFEENLNTFALKSGDILSKWNVKLADDNINNSIITVKNLKTDTKNSYKFDYWLSKYVNTNQLEEFTQMIQQLINKEIKEINFEFQPKDKQGNIQDKWIQIKGKIFDKQNKQIKHISGTARDITIRKKLMLQLEEYSNTDALTKLNNKRYFDNHLIKALANIERNNSQLALVMLDLNFFKKINDNLGHDVGDGLLREIGNELKNNFRENDIICRLGGDEFTLIMTDIKKNINYTEMIYNKFKNIFNHNYLIKIDTKIFECFIGASIAVVSAPLDSKNPNILMKKVDKMMYAAKFLCKNKTQKMSIICSNNLDIQHCISEDNNGFYLMQKNINTGNRIPVFTLDLNNEPHIFYVIEKEDAQGVTTYDLADDNKDFN